MMSLHITTYCLKGGKQMDKGKDKNVYSYTLPDKVKIKYINFCWRIFDLLSYKIKKIARIYDKLISSEYIRENKMFDINKSKSILHIGCGSYPLTAMTLSKLNGGKIVGIDKSYSAIKRADKVISDKNLKDQVSVKLGNGSNFPLDDFDTIIVSSCSIPKNMILEHLFENAPKDCKIIVREQHGPAHLVSDYIELYRDNISVEKKIENNAFQTAKWKSYCLVKK